MRARLALAEGDGEAAENWARSAAGYASLTDDMTEQANAKLDLARILTALERPEAAIPEARAACDLFLIKGDRPVPTRRAPCSIGSATDIAQAADIAH